jgi:hypothetical protein
MCLSFSEYFSIRTHFEKSLHGINVTPQRLHDPFVWGIGADDTAKELGCFETTAGNLCREFGVHMRCIEIV